MLHFINASLRALLKLAAANALPQELFDPKIEIGRSKELFKSYVKHFEIEHHSYCNRTCWFCPNSVVDRKSVNLRMNKKTLLKIFSQLAEIDYDQSIIWGGYGEPLSDETIFDDIRMARDMLPHVYQRLYSNGDYLTAEVVRRLEAAGLDQLRVSLYPESDRDLEMPKLLKSLEDRTGLKIATKTREYDGVQLIGSSFLILVEVKDFRAKHMFSRGGALLKESGQEAYARTLLCFSPIQHLSVAYDGQCMLCCQVRPINKQKEGVSKSLTP